MKRIIKVGLISVFLIIMIIALVACGAKEPKTYKVLSNAFKDNNYLVKVEGETSTIGETEGVQTMIIGVKGENIVMEVDSTIMHASIMYKDGKTYTIIHNEKMYIVSEGKDEEALDVGIAMSDKELEKLKKSEYETGRENIDGKEYETETYNMENGTKRAYYFENQDLKYIKVIDGSEETLMKIIEISDNAPDELFEIPTEYELYGD